MATYTVTGLEPAINEPDSELTINRLIAAGTDYPDWVEPFTTVKPGSVGKRTIDAAAKIRDELKAKGQDDPYRLAEAIQNHLRTDPHFHYAVDTTCSGPGDGPGLPAADRGRVLHAVRHDHDHDAPDPRGAGPLCRGVPAG